MNKVICRPLVDSFKVQHERDIFGRNPSKCTATFPVHRDAVRFLRALRYVSVTDVLANILFGLFLYTSARFQNGQAENLSPVQIQVQCLSVKEGKTTVAFPRHSTLQLRFNEHGNTVCGVPERSRDDALCSLKCTTGSGRPTRCLQIDRGKEYPSYHLRQLHMCTCTGSGAPPWQRLTGPVGLPICCRSGQGHVC